MQSFDFTRRQMLGASVAGLSGIFLTTGCTTGSLTEAVNAVVVAADLTLGVLEATGVVPPSIVMLVSPYLSSVGQAVIDTNTEAQSMDTAAVKAAKIAAIWANLANGVTLPPGTPAVVSTVLAEVVAAIKALLAIVNNGQLQLKRLGEAHSQYQMTRGDRHVMGQLTKKAMAIKTRAMALSGGK